MSARSPPNHVVGMGIESKIMFAEHAGVQGSEWQRRFYTYLDMTEQGNVIAMTQAHNLIGLSALSKYKDELRALIAQRIFSGGEALKRSLEDWDRYDRNRAQQMETLAVYYLQRHNRLKIS